MVGLEGGLFFRGTLRMKRDVILKGSFFGMKIRVGEI